MNDEPAFIATNGIGKTVAWSADDDDDTHNGRTILGWLRNGRTVRHGTIGEACQAMANDSTPTERTPDER